MNKNKRAHKRIELPAKVTLSHSNIGEVILNLRDISDGGVYVKCDNPELLPIGAKAQMQVVNKEIEMPILDVIVVRKDAEGMGMKFEEK